MGRSGRVAGAGVAVGLPVVLCVALHSSALTAAGQFALWWSVPWAAGILVAASGQAPVVRRTALAAVLVSVALTCACAAASPLFGFGLRLPEG